MISLNAHRPLPVSILFVILAVFASLVTIVLVVTDYRYNFVHPDNYGSVLTTTVSTGLGFGTGDLITAMMPRGPDEFRPRFLTYIIEGIDQKLRLFLGHYLVLLPTFRPVSWFLQLGIGPVLLFSVLRRMDCDRVAALAAVAVYLSSIGFLSGFGMAFLPGKGLVTVALASAIYIMTRIPAGTPLTATSWRLKVSLFFALFIGLFLDEVGTFAFFLLPIVFHDLFLTHKPGTPIPRLHLASIALFSLPGFIFIFIMLVIMTPLSEHLFGLRYDWLGNVLAVGDAAMGASSFFEGPQGSFSWAVLWQNLTNFFGLSLVPRQVAPLINSPTADYPILQVNNAVKLTILALMLGVCIAASALSRRQAAVYLRRFLLATPLFIVLMTALSVRHIPLITGYYYGSTFSLIFAILIGLAIGAARDIGREWQLVGSVTALVITIVQINNFWPINAGWKLTHDERVTRPRYTELGLVPYGHHTRHAELQAIHEAWKAGRLSEYLRDHRIPIDALPLVHELKAIERLEKK